MKGTLHWVSAGHGIRADVYLYEKLLKDNEGPKGDTGTWGDVINPDSVKLLKNCLLEPFVEGALPEAKFNLCAMDISVPTASTAAKTGWYSTELFH